MRSLQSEYLFSGFTYKAEAQIKYFGLYHVLIPILDLKMSVTATQKDCQLLFLKITTTACRSIRPELFEKLSVLLLGLASGSFYRSYSVLPYRALLVLCMSSMPTQKSREDVRNCNAGGTINWSVQIGRASRVS